MIISCMDYTLKNIHQRTAVWFSVWEFFILLKGTERNSESRNSRTKIVSAIITADWED